MVNGPYRTHAPLEGLGFYLITAGKRRLEFSEISQVNPCVFVQIRRMATGEDFRGRTSQTICQQVKVVHVHVFVAVDITRLKLSVNFELVQGATIRGAACVSVKPYITADTEQIDCFRTTCTSCRRVNSGPNRSRRLKFLCRTAVRKRQPSRLRPG